jgi:hypothetical protein
MLVIELFFAAPTDAVFWAGYDETEKSLSRLSEVGSLVDKDLGGASHAVRF